MSDTTLRPRLSTELVDAAFQLLRRHYTSFLIVSGIGLIPWLIVQPLVARSFAAGADSGDLGAAFASMLSGLVLNMLSAIWFSLAGAAIIALASQAYIDGDVDVARALRTVLDHWWAVLATSFLRGIAIFLGLFAFLVGALYCYATYFAVPTTVVVERLGARAALARSEALAKGYRAHALKPLILSLLIYLCVMIATGIIASMLFGNSTGTLANIFSTLVTVLVYPLVPITEMLVYYDLRIRREGYDVELMASRLDGATGVSAE